MPERDYELLKRRLAVVRDCIAKGEGLSQAAKKLGLTPPGLFQYLDAAGYRDLRLELGDQTRIGTCLPETEHVKRLQTVIECGSQVKAAREIGISPSALSKWLKDNGYGPNFKADLLDLVEEDDIED